MSQEGTGVTTCRGGAWHDTEVGGRGGSVLHAAERLSVTPWRGACVTAVGRDSRDA